MVPHSPLDRLASAVPYLRDLNSVPMRQTPGQLFDQELKSRKIGKTAFAERIKRTYVTVNNWTKDEGFHSEQRALAARGLGLPSDYFDHPDLAAQREQYRLNVIDEFRHVWPPRPPLSEEEWRSLESIRFPQDKLPTVAFYEGFVHLLRGNISAAQFGNNVGPNELADHLNRTSAHKRKPAKKQGSPRKSPPQK